MSQKTTDILTAVISLICFCISVRWTFVVRGQKRQAANLLPDDRSTDPPLGFNLGVLLFYPWYRLSYRLPWVLAFVAGYFLPGIGLIWGVYDGIGGMRTAWVQSKKATSARAFEQANISWANAASLFVLIISLLLALSFGITFFSDK